MDNDNKDERPERPDFLPSSVSKRRIPATLRKTSTRLMIINRGIFYRGKIISLSWHSRANSKAPFSRGKCDQIRIGSDCLKNILDLLKEKNQGCDFSFSKVFSTSLEKDKLPKGDPQNYSLLNIRFPKRYTMICSTPLNTYSNVSSSHFYFTSGIMGLNKN